jgi:hypothetical protein
MTITFSGNNIRIKSSKGNNTVGSTMSPYSFKVYSGVEYTISSIKPSSNSEMKQTGSIISSIQYANIVENTYTGSFKGTNKFTVKPSYMKRVICEGTGTARIYVLSPKGEALVNITLQIK